MLPTWSDSCSINNERIDEQHKKLFKLAAQAHALNKQKATKEDIKKILSSFFEYMKVHFKDEEEYMLSIDYPQLEYHKKIHQQIIDDLVKLIHEIHTIKDLKEQLEVIAKEWLLEHILHEDMKIAAWEKEFFARKNRPKKPEEEKFYYVCGCYDKVHVITKDIHQKIQEGASFSCKACAQEIKFQKH